MTDEPVLKEKNENEAAEPELAKPEVAKEKKEYKRSDYEYKSWSGGVPVPDGWERCPGYYDVIKRLKTTSPEAEVKPGQDTPDNAS